MHHGIEFFGCIWKFGIGVHALYHASWHLWFSNFNWYVGLRGLVHSLDLEVHFCWGPVWPVLTTGLIGCSTSSGHSAMQTGLTGLCHRSDRLVHVEPHSTMQTGLTGPLHRSDRLSADRGLSVVFKWFVSCDFFHDSDISCGHDYFYVIKKCN